MPETTLTSPRSDTPRFGLSLPNRAALFGVPPEDMLRAAEVADQSGAFDGVWVGDNFLSKPRLEAIVTLSAVAARTKRVTLGTICLASFPLRNPLPFAIQWASLDRLSGGRAFLTVCSGGAASFGPLFAKVLEVMGVASTERVAPHTLPADAYLTIDRRLLPGDEPAAVPDEIGAAIGDLAPWSATVEGDVYMLPALGEGDHPGVRALQSANRTVRGQEAETYYGLGTFDAGGPCALGVPTVMYGASGGEFTVGVDFVPISAVETEARVLAHLILDQLA